MTEMSPIRLSSPNWFGPLISFSLLAVTLQAAGPQPGFDAYRFQRLTNADGLSHNSIRSILQDRHGFMWFGTVDGLNRYDGYEFKIFRRQSGDSSSLPLNEITALFEDKRGQLWVGFLGGLARMQPGGGFHAVDLREQLGQREVIGILEGDNHELWLVAIDGIFRFDPLEKSLETVILLELRRQEGMLFGSDVPLARTLATLESGVPGPIFAKLASCWLQPHAAAFGPNPKGGLLCEAVARRGRENWFGCNRGLYRRDNHTGSLDRIPLEKADDAWLQNYVRSLYVDASDTLWIGTQGGLFRLDPRLQRFRNWSDIGRPDQSIGSVSSILEDDDGDLWLGTFGAGLKQVVRQTGQVRHYPLPDPPPAGCSSVIWSLEQGPGRQLWMGTNQGLCRFHQTERRFLAGSAALSGKSAEIVHRDRYGRYWLGDNLKTMIAGDGELLVLPDELRFGVGLADRKGRFLWAGGGGPELTRFDLDTLERHVLKPLGPNIGRIFEIHEARQGGLWFGSSEGLYQLDPTTLEFTHVGIDDGLPGSVVYSIEEDDRGGLWLGTNRGLSRVRFDELGRPQVWNFDRADGITSSEFNRGAALRTRNGELFFGGMQGLTSFFPDQIQQDRVPPPVVVTRIEYSRREGAVTHDLEVISDLTLSYEDYAVSFEYAALSYTKPHENRYRYILEGFDPDWIETGTRRLAKYTNLPPGRYTFRVQGSNSDGVWNRDGAALAVTVRPPYWQTWWFRLLIAGSLATGLGLLYRFRVRQLLEMERLRIRIAEDLHDDLSTDLTGIALATGVLKKSERLGDREKSRLTQIEKAARRSVEALRDIVWMTAPEHDTLESLARRIQNVCGQLLPDGRWTFEARGLDRQSIPMKIRRDLFLVFKEALHNAARHARADRVVVCLAKTGNRLRLVVRDDGVGFESGSGHGHGLRNLQRRAKGLAADIQVESAPGKGTTISLELDLARTRDVAPSGSGVRWS